MKLVLTCEHAGNEIPGKYLSLFEANLDVLHTHRGFDPGAYDLFKKLSPLADFKASHLESRLLIEVNRSLHHSSLFSSFTGKLPNSEKNTLIEEYYLLYRKRVEDAIGRYVTQGEEVLHFSIHSFTPRLDGITRNADIGLLYDPARPGEKHFCKVFKKNLKILNPKLKVRFNYPYLGTADGFTTYLRKKFPNRYSGVELEVNQKFVAENKMQPGLKNIILEALQKSK
ncbi:MAG: N-formylglutamate amidohydrolase [Gillisia sp.]